ncbi:TonB-dependent receptor [Cytophaga sp. FL35]|uniref:SusC/RagA family TonB-linked outer membrane protein n=1 Tax=Cytophaga sp. FL35 TaxID=1904456 RepID=UPI0016534487|nr:TonB-dependent receptor [Cytophaga sp. FL35]MBC7000330.1 TonB-dependent receptor [Cytophaga sp. FL35]
MNQLFFSFIICMFISSQIIHSQTTTVKGEVTSNNGEPLPGVNVVEKGTSNGTVTDFDGLYSIKVTTETPILVFSSIGFGTQEISAVNISDLNVTLEEDAQALDEVVLVGYGTQKKQDLTGAIVSADLEQFQESPNTSVLQSLQGSLPGITVGQTSTTGAEPDIQIRGRSTLNGSQDPLIVVDGVIYRGRLNDLNPKDIKSVDVLKDPSSKAIYGAQAANGIVIVSTKSGKSTQRPTINYSTFYAVQTPTNTRRTNNRDEFLRSARDVDWENGYLAPDYTQDNPAWSPGVDPVFNPTSFEGVGNGTDFDWFGTATNPGYTQDHQLSIRGSSDKTSYFISAGLTNQVGWITNDNYDRQTVRVNIDTKITDWLTIGANTFGTFSDFSGVNPGLNALARMNPLVTPRDEEGEYIINPLGNNIVNPFLASSADDRDNLNNISAIFYASIDIPQVDGLNFRVNYSNNYRWSLRGNSNIYGAGLTGSAFKETSSTHDVLVDNILTFDKRYGQDENHGFKATLVVGLNTIDYEQTMAEGSGFGNLALSYNSLEQAVIQRISSDASKESYTAQTGRINYDFKRKYLLSASLRRDGFSGFSENNKTALFPSIGLGWVISNEEFLANSEAVTNLKLRGSYGSNGNLTSQYSSLSRLETPPESRYLFGDGGTTVNGQTVISLANPDLRWERTDGINIGADFGFFQNRASGSIDYYNSRTKDLLWDFILPELSGFSSIRSNVGEIKNTGLEFTLSFSPVRSEQFNWDFGVNFASNRNEIVELLGIDADSDGREDDLIANGLFIGESIGTIYDYEVDGFYQVDDDNIPDGWSPGLQRLVDLDNSGDITPDADRRILGREEPAYQFGISNSLSYKNFAFKFFINSIQGGSDGYLGRNNPDLQDSFGNAQNNNRFSDIDYWSPLNPNSTYRRLGVNAPVTAQRFFDRSFVRLQDVSLSYRLPQDVLDNIGIQNLKLFLSGKNLVTWTDWEGWDPETGQGLDSSNSGLPVMKSVTFGLDISF